jgi:membrane-bound inhibitor of C-type lysozyme
METVVALLMFVNFEIKEHRIQESMGMCLRGKREAERTYSETVSYKCVKTQAELEVNNDGSRSIKKIILN